VNTYAGQLYRWLFFIFFATVCANLYKKKGKLFDFRGVGIDVCGAALAANCGLCVWPKAISVVGVTGIIWWPF